MLVFGPRNKYLDFSGVQDDSNDTLTYYINMEGYSYISIQYIEGTNDGTQTLKIYASNENVKAADATYTDVTNTWFSENSFISSSWIERDTTTACKFIKLEMAITDMTGGDTSVWTMHVTKKSR